MAPSKNNANTTAFFKHLGRISFGGRASVSFLFAWHGFSDCF
jgi:hypothetical protein